MLRMKKTIALLGFILLYFSSTAQLQKEKLKVFVDCSNTWCSMDYIKTEITIVDYVLDNTAADVHVLVTEQSTGGGGSSYQMIFFGQNNFRNLKDTIRFFLPPNTTDFEGREILNKYLKIGLIPYLLKTEMVKNIEIQMKQSAKDSAQVSVHAPANDPWNYWVFNIGANGNFSGDQVYKGVIYSTNVSVNRITDQIKVSFSFYANKDKTTYTLEDPDGVVPPFRYIKNNHGYGFDHQLVKSINQHWSYGYNVNLSNNTFSNYKLQTTLSPAIEYNLFPYTQSTNKLLTIRYGVDLRMNRYIDTTIYFKTKETLFGHWATVALSFNQKWGGAGVGMNYHHYFTQHWKYYSFGMSGSVSVRISGGLRFNCGIFAGLTRDQLSLSGEQISQRDVLTRRRQIASDYNYFSYFGINYRFGSKLNNFVNPRFEGGNSMIF
jgi:hypothetical protein